MSSSFDTRPSPIAGQWYPDDPQRLATSIDRYLAAANLPELNGEVIAVMAPHAGHRYSGPVAGYAFAALRGLAPELVAVVSPMHHLSPYPLLTTAHQAYATPLGVLPVDREALSELDHALQDRLGHGLVPVERDPEHSLEIELPFLQRAFTEEFKILPIMVRDPSVLVSKGLGSGLAQVLQKHNALMVASTDLSHFYPQPVAYKFDQEMLRRVESFDPEGVLRAEDEGVGFACGRGALAAVMWAARELGATTAQVLHYATSGDVTGDFAQVVGYAAAVFLRPE